MSVITVTGADGVPVTTVVQGDIIAGEVLVDPPATGTERDRAGGSEPGDSPAEQPRVIRGEIAGRPRADGGDGADPRI
jgi:hypothetical protein